MKLIPLFFLFFPFLTFDQKVEMQNNILTGSLFDKASNAPLAYLNIGIHDTEIGTVSKENGRYSFKIPENIPDNDSVSFSFMGSRTTLLLNFRRRQMDGIL